MANDEHVALLKQGVDAWNAWRDEDRNIRPDLSGANLGKANLSTACLYERCMVLARGLSKLYLDDVTNGGTCGRCHPNITLTENAVPRTPGSNLQCFERSGPLLSRPSLKAFVR
jgi:hypothetical protein